MRDSSSASAPGRADIQEGSSLMSKDAKSKSKAKELKIVGKVRVIDRNPGAKELHDGQVEAWPA
jgi:hypothetical protein